MIKIYKNDGSQGGSQDSEETGTYDVIITCKETGDPYVAHLPLEYAPPHGSMETFGQGIMVRGPGVEPVYINAATRQMSRNPEVCRSSMIVDPRFVNLGRVHNDTLIKKVKKLYKFDPRKTDRV